jgi:hypothetical protein
LTEEQEKTVAHRGRVLAEMRTAKMAVDLLQEIESDALVPNVWLEARQVLRQLLGSTSKKDWIEKKSLPGSRR